MSAQARLKPRFGFAEPKWPVFLLLALVILTFAVPPIFNQASSAFTIYNVLQNTAVLGMVALGLGLTMIVGEFDLSVAGTYALGGMVAVKLGTGNPLVGLLAALAVCVTFGLIQGLIIAKLKINSMALTLGGYLVALGLTGTIGNNKSQSFSNYEIGIQLNQPIGTVFSIRIFIGIAVFLAVFLLMNLTNLGRGMRATGGGRRASRTAGVRVDAVVILTFGASAGLAALGGILQAYCTATATSNPGLFPLIFAVTACLLGGLGLAGGRGGAFGIACGALTIAMLSELFSTVAAPAYVTGLFTGLLLIVVTTAASPYVVRKWRERRIDRSLKLESKAFVTSDSSGKS
ncbi:MAG: ABC transporter permease [Actinobacteria bacterium]|nr:ABC transporter permease [Actinomycetota bacterium]